MEYKHILTCIHTHTHLHMHIHTHKSGSGGLSHSLILKGAKSLARKQSHDQEAYRPLSLGLADLCQGEFQHMRIHNRTTIDRLE